VAAQVVLHICKWNPIFFSIRFLILPLVGSVSASRVAFRLASSPFLTTIRPATAGSCPATAITATER
jgi:hypothetical protein